MAIKQGRRRQCAPWSAAQKVVDVVGHQKVGFGVHGCRSDCMEIQPGCTLHIKKKKNKNKKKKKKKNEENKEVEKISKKSIQGKNNKNRIKTRQNVAMPIVPSAHVAPGLQQVRLPGCDHCFFFFKKKTKRSKRRVSSDEGSLIKRTSSPT